MSLDRHLGTITESGLSDTQLSTPTSEPSSPGEAFRYIGSSTEPSEEGSESEEEEFVYPGVAATGKAKEIPQEIAQLSAKPRPSPAQLESLYAAASSGDLPQLKRLFQNALETGGVQAFALANEASSRTGFTVLHAAASRGYLDIVRWLVEDCGAMPDLEDKEGETALHKAALNGYILVIKYLIQHKADVHARDADGWTALHNTCSKGYLDIVRWLCEEAGAATEVNSVRGVDMRSKGGWTPLMNASSKGHLPIVLYLLSKQSANPLIRNNWGETAYDAAAAVFEIWICEVLQKFEADKWRGTTVPYNPLAVHTTVPLVLYENQRLDMRLKTLAVTGGRPRFSATGLGKHGRHVPFELKLPKVDEETRASVIPAWRSDVQLPSRDSPWDLPMPTPDSQVSERSHFWLSDWTLDVTHPGVDAEDGWQYAQSFQDPDESWTAEQSPHLRRLLSGSGAVAANLSGSGSTRPIPVNSPGSSSSRAARSQAWVRRRRWVRVMRRRLDIPPLPFLEPDGNMYHLDVDGTKIPHFDEDDDITGHSDGQELGFMPSTLLSSAQDYVARARYLVGTQYRDANGTEDSAIEVRRAIAKLERATTELRQGLLGDEDNERRTQAEVLLNAYSRELDRKRLDAGARGLMISGEDDASDDDGDSDEEFHYPGASPPGTIRAASILSSSTDYFNSRPSSSRTVNDLTPQLSHAPDFRVPTHEAPQKVTPRWSSPSPHPINAQWERDEAVLSCRECQRRFNFLIRRHCRRCGRIFCDRDSSRRMILDPSDIVHDPTVPEPAPSNGPQRVCQSCFDQANASIPSRFQTRVNSLERIVVSSARLTIPTHAQSSSQLSDLAECPVCNCNLDDLGSAADQEVHVKNCLDGGSGSVPQSAKYLVYDLPAESTLIGVECVICLEEFVKGSKVARLSCLCSFHNACLSSWLSRGRSCPVHAR